jgi:hypothetical protein
VWRPPACSVDSHGGLGVVALHEAVGAGHDPRCCVDQLDRVLSLEAGCGRLGLIASGLFTRCAGPDGERASLRSLLGAVCGVL